ncbi:hypothetical protein HMPREF1249_0861 [Jonquetella sp. BV3C21]|nr:hypothetical protein HMPREF1249_0861 [Jonquetella sp. BV3C21]
MTGRSFFSPAKRAGFSADGTAIALLGCYVLFSLFSPISRQGRRKSSLRPRCVAQEGAARRFAVLCGCAAQGDALEAVWKDAGWLGRAKFGGRRVLGGQ